MDAFAEQRRQDYLRSAETLGELTKNSVKWQRSLAGQLNSREAVDKAAEDFDAEL